MQRELTTHAPSPASGYVDYEQIEADYAAQLAAEVGAAVTVTKKWQPEDLIWPHSDIDLRLVLDDAPTDWLIFNEQLAAVHHRMVTRQPGLRRILEHPPGWVFLRREVEAGLVPAAELATWSLCAGDPTELERWRASVMARPWSSEDERFYRVVLAGRTAGRYQLRADSDANVVHERGRYPAHCVTWHFLAPVLFAHSALSARLRPTGKSQVLATHEDPRVRGFWELTRRTYEAAPEVSAILAAAQAVVAGLRPLRPAGPGVAGPTAAEVVSALGALRCRVARYLYYLSPPPDVSSGYLVDRETKDLHAAVRVLAAARSQMTGAAGRAADRLVDLVPPPPTTRAALRAVLDGLYDNRRSVQLLFSSSLIYLWKAA